MTRSVSLPRRLLAVAAVVMLLGAGCSDDDGGTSSSGGETGRTTTTGTAVLETTTTIIPGSDDPAVTGYCTEVQTSLTGGDRSASLGTIADKAPEVLKPKMDAFRTALENPDDEAARSAGLAAFLELLVFNRDVCGIPIDWS